MSTRSVIARMTQTGFTGTYHHWDGYPSGLGATLFELFNGHFQRELNPMLEFLIDQHPAGWSTINGADFNLPPGYNADNHDAVKNPQCYCHGNRKENGNKITERNAAGCGCEWAYVLLVEAGKPVMRVLSSRHADNSKAIGWFGSGDEAAHWHLVTTVQLLEAAPDWKQLNQEG